MSGDGPASLAIPVCPNSGAFHGLNEPGAETGLSCAVLPPCGHEW